MARVHSNNEAAKNPIYDNEILKKGGKLKDQTLELRRQQYLQVAGA